MIHRRKISGQPRSGFDFVTETEVRGNGLHAMTERGSCLYVEQAIIRTETVHVSNKNSNLQ